MPNPLDLLQDGNEDVYWKNAVVAWALFYNKIPKIKLSKMMILEDLSIIAQAELYSIHYVKWSEKRGDYLGYAAEGLLL